MSSHFSLKLKESNNNWFPVLNLELCAEFYGRNFKMRIEEYQDNDFIVLNSGNGFVIFYVPKDHSGRFMLDKRIVFVIPQDSLTRCKAYLFLKKVPFFEGPDESLLLRDPNGFVVEIIPESTSSFN